MQQMSRKLYLANYHAEKSLPRWNQNRLSRVYHRKKYHAMVDRWYRSKEGKRVLAAHKEMPKLNNPYPWPLYDPHFADWDEDDSSDNYSLTCDPAKMVTKWSTSYCACMIRAVTGKWLKYDAGKRDANNWVMVLEANGYNKIVRVPEYDRYYVGILKDENADDGHGLVVWFEERKNGLITYSTYQNHQYVVSMERANRFVWVEITL